MRDREATMDMQAFDLVRQLAASQYLVRALHVVVELGVADVVGDDVTPVADVASAVGADADALLRVLRLLASRGVFVLDGDAVGQSEASQLLRSGHPASLNAFVRMFAQPIQWETAGDLMFAVTTGRAASDHVFADGGIWGYLDANPTEAAVFGRAMAEKSVAQIADILSAHDFSSYERVVDIGGGHGHLLRGILARHPGVNGCLFDLPPVIDAARTAGPNERLSFTAGDFFTTPLPSGDAVVLMEVLHDWDDEHCGAILQAVRRIAQVDTKLLIIEIEMTEGTGPDWPKLLDVVMLGLFAARQRTNREYQTLLDANGFTVTAQVSTPTGMTIIEATPDRLDGSRRRASVAEASIR
jgi:SAM-dependent methyltransferase